MGAVIVWHPDGRRVLRDQGGWPVLTAEPREPLAEAAQRSWGLECWVLHDGGHPVGRPEPAHLRALSTACPPGLVWADADQPPLQRTWQRPTWPEDAAQLIDTALTQVGRTRKGRPRPVHSTDLVSVIVADTTAGPVFFKASHTGREAAVTTYLARHHAHLTPPLLWVDETQGILLTASGGELLDRVGDLSPWEEAVTQLAQFQLQADSQALADLGCPALPLAETAERVDALLGDPAILSGWGVRTPQQDILTAQRPQIRAAFQNLAALDLPDLPSHGDAHPRNALSGPRGSVWFDWSETLSAAHPLLDAGWFLWWTLNKAGLPVAQGRGHLGPHLARTYLTALGCPDALPLLLEAHRPGF